MAPPPPSLVESLRDRYRLERELGRGGMATVHLARDPGIVPIFDSGVVPGTGGR